MKIAVFSDLHGNYQATKSIVADIKEIKFDRDGFINDIKSFKYPDQDFIAKVLLGVNVCYNNCRKE